MMHDGCCFALSKTSPFLRLCPRLSTQLFPQILARRESGHLFEESSEMMRKIEAEEARGLADIVTAHEQALGLVDDIIVDVADGCSSCGFVDNIAEISWRISQL